MLFGVGRGAPSRCDLENTMQIALAQLNPVVGDVRGNLRKLLDLLPKAAAHSQLLVLPELYLSGYPVRDLLALGSFITAIEEGLRDLCMASRAYPGLGILCGAPTRNPASHGKGLFNSALLIANGRILAQQNKLLLPFYDVFDELRYFDPAAAQHIFAFGGERLGICVCEDAWGVPEAQLSSLYDRDPVGELVAAGATLIINISASPFHRRKELLRYQIALTHVRRHGIPFVLVNQVGANDELIFDGRSFALSGNGQLLADLPGFREEVRFLDLQSAQQQEGYRVHPEAVNVRAALTMGVKDYFRKVHAREALIGLSGGIDSALTLCIAADALGANNVHAVAMPGPYSSEGSVKDSQALAERLGVPLTILPITDIFATFLGTLEPSFRDLPEDATEENLQARIRGVLLMALANKFNHLVLATSNKSELSVGYTTLYGDMVGALAVIADVFKTHVYELAHVWNADQEIIPRAILDKPPTAELRPNQVDLDSLPPYDVLDDILQLHVEEGWSPAQIIAAGRDAETVAWVTAAVRCTEYKRCQAAPTLRVTYKSFGSGRRIPVAARHGV